MGIMSLIGKLLGTNVVAPPDAMKLDGTTEATLARSLSAVPTDERGWITFAEARIQTGLHANWPKFGSERPADKSGHADFFRRR